MSTALAHNFIAGLSLELQLEVSAYIETLRINKDAMGCADLALILLRINTTESLEAASQLTGRAITRCPAFLPPWPPKPVLRKTKELIVLRKAKASPKGEHMARHFSYVRVGMTREQMQSKGATARDIRYWINHGYIEMGTRP